MQDTKTAGPEPTAKQIAEPTHKASPKEARSLLYHNEAHGENVNRLDGHTSRSREAMICLHALELVTDNRLDVAAKIGAILGKHNAQHHYSEMLSHLQQSVQRFGADAVRSALAAVVQAQLPAEGRCA